MTCGNGERSNRGAAKGDRNAGLDVFEKLQEARQNVGPKRPRQWMLRVVARMGERCLWLAGLVKESFAGGKTRRIRENQSWATQNSKMASKVINLAVVVFVDDLG